MFEYADKWDKEVKEGADRYDKEVSGKHRKDEE